MVEIIIEGKKEKFDPNAIEWMQKRDFFSITKMAGNKCFIKKYVGKKPTAWDLMIALIGKENTNMPKVHDAVFDKTTKTYYVVTEYIRGVPLKDYILKGDMVPPLKVMEDLDIALTNIHSEKYWFSDFNEENIFVTSGFKKKVLLIDIDSCWSSSLRPNHVGNEKGGLPGAAQNIGRHVLEFYNKYLPSGKSHVKYEDLPGENFNYLQLIVLCVKLNIFQNRSSIDKTFKYIRPENFRDLEKIIHDCDSNYAKGVFMLAKDSNRVIRPSAKQLINRIINLK